MFFESKLNRIKVLIYKTIKSKKSNGLAKKIFIFLKATGHTYNFTKKDSIPSLFLRIWENFPK